MSFLRNVNIHIITEEYTSQTCLNCKNLTKTNNEIFICKCCNFTIDRDILGSTNILLKNW
jgi:transposase